MPKKNKDIKHGNKYNKEQHLHAHVGPNFMVSTFKGEYEGISDELNIRETDYYKKKRGSNN